MLHHLMIGTWTPPGAIFTVEFDDEALTLRLVKKTEIPHDEPISWMTFDVGSFPSSPPPTNFSARKKKYLRRVNEEMVELRRRSPSRHLSHLLSPHGR